MDEGGLIEFELVAFDPDDDDLSFTWNRDDLPEDAEFTDNGDWTANFFWQTGFGDAGEYHPVFIVTDDDLEAEIEITITVGDVNRTPVWGDITESYEVDEGDLLEFTVNGDDPDGDDLTIEYMSDNLPESVEFTDNGDGSASFSWEPTFDDAGDYVAFFNLSDGELSADFDVEITILNVNHPPEWVDVPDDVSGTVEDLIELTFTADDPDGDDLTLSMADDGGTGERGAEFENHGDNTGTFSWQTAFEDDGEYNLCFTAYDAEATIEFEVSITLTGLPLIVVEPDELDFDEVAAVVDIESETIAISNDGAEPLTVSRVDFNENEFSSDLDLGSFESGWEQRQLGMSHSILISRALLNGENLEEGSEIAVFTPDGLCAGVREVEEAGEQIGIPAWKDNPDTDEIEGFRDDEAFILRYWDVVSGREIVAEVEYLSGPRTFENNGLTRVNLSAETDEFEDIVIDPDESMEVTIHFEPTEVRTYEAEMRIGSNDPHNEIVIVDLNGVGTNSTPVVVDPIEDVEVNEDCDLYEVADLNEVFNDPNLDDLTFSVEGSDQLNLNITEENVLTLEPADDFYGENLEVTVTADDGREEEHNPTETETFIVNVISVNDLPVIVDGDGEPLEASISLSVDENEELQVILRADDIDNEGNELSWGVSDENGLPDGWALNGNEDGTAEFVWTPDYEAGREEPYTPLFIVTDAEEESDELTINITVNHVNLPPLWDEPDPDDVIQGAENEELTICVQGHDPDADDLTIAWESAGERRLPVGDVEFTDNSDGSGTFVWTPTYEEAGDYIATLTLSDDEYDVSIDIAISVDNTNRVPVWTDVPERVEDDETEIIEFAVRGSDPDGDDLTIIYRSDDLPEAVEFTYDENGVSTFSWETTYEDAGEYTASFRLSDGSLEVVTDVTVVVNNVNRAPYWEEIPDEIAVEEDELLEFEVTGVDPDGDDLTIEYHSEDLPEAFNFNDEGDGVGAISWTPGFEEAGEYNAVLTLSDGDLVAVLNLPISVIDVNRTPVWDEPDPDQPILGNEDEEIAFDVRVHDPDGDDVTIEMTDRGGLPEDAEFTDSGNGTGNFSWETDFDDEGSYTPVFTVSDGELSAEFELTIAIGDVNLAPIWEAPDPDEPIRCSENQELVIDVEASDPNDDDITIELTDLEGLPEDVEFTDNGDGTGQLRWQTGFENAGEYNPIFTVADHELSIEVELTINIIDVNREPIWVDVPDVVEGNEDELIEFTITGEDPDDDNLTITCHSDNLPDGFDFIDNEDGTGTFTWEAGFEDAGEYTAVFTLSDDEFDVISEVNIVVNDVNRAPEIVNPIENIEIEEDADQLEIVDLDNVFEDPDGDELNYVIIDGAEELNLSIDEETNILSAEPAPNYFGNSEVLIEADDGQEAMQIGMIARFSRDNEDPSHAERGPVRVVSELRTIPTTALARNHNITTSQHHNITPPRRDDSIANQFTVSVLSINDLPVIVDEQGEPLNDEIIVHVREGAELHMTFYSADIEDDGGDLSWSIADDGDLPDGWELTDNEDGTADFNWNPGFDVAGDYQPVVQVMDSDEGSDEITLNISVFDINLNPVITEPEGERYALRVNEGVDFSVHFAAGDPDGDDLTWSIADEGGLPEGWEFNQTHEGEIAEAEFTWDVCFDAAGEYEPLFRVEDDQGGSDEVTVVITIVDVHRRPVWDDVPLSVEVDEGELLEFTVSGSSPDDYDLTIIWESTGETDIPVDQVEFTDNEDGTGTFSWQPIHEDAGSYIALFTLSDGELEVTEDVRITVNDVNRDPVITQPEDEEIHIRTFEAEELILEFTAEDPDGDDLAWSVADDGDLLDGWEFTDNEDGTAQFIWTPGWDGDGEYNPLFRVADGEGGADEVRISITVGESIPPEPHIVEPTDEPEWETEVDEGEELRFTLRAIDNDNDDDELEWTIIVNSRELRGRLENNDDGGLDFVGTPDYDAGREEPYDVEIEVRDPDDWSDELLVHITVNNVIRPPHTEGLEDDEVHIEEDSDWNLIVEDLREFWINPDEYELDYTFADPDPNVIEQRIGNPDEDDEFSYWIRTSEENWNGRVECVLSASFEDEINVDYEFVLIIDPVNDPPVIWVDGQPVEDEQPLPFEVNENEELIIEMEGRDVDNDGAELTWTVSDENDLPDGWEFNDNENGTAVFVWTPDFANAGEYEPVFRVEDDDEAILLPVIITVLNVNRTPGIVDPLEDVEFEEDSGSWEIGSLQDVFSDPDEEELEFTVEATDPLTYEINEASILTINAPENYNAPDGVNIIVTATDSSDAAVSDTFLVVITPVNDAPEAFSLTSPEDGFEVERDNYEITLEWQDAEDVDEDEVTYNLFIGVEFEDIDTSITRSDIAATEFTIEHLDSMLIGLGIVIAEGDVRVEAEWWVEATDSEAVTESNERWTIIVLIPTSAPASEDGLPTEFSLSPIYPNPFNPSTHINYALPQPSYVRLIVWDASGRLLEVITASDKPAGRHSITWTADNMPTGIYIFTLEAGGVRKVIKGLLIR
ncbi:MAG: Ig-like domain-containing protein [Candidatus Hatepunaea meridiana]|nr:Ig-like domain-containing protein [Candidatus Hatepunaea meridiana]